MLQLKRRLWILTAIGFCLAVGVSLFLQNFSAVTKAYQSYCSTYEVWGRVADFGTDASVEAVKVSTNGEHTYTNWEGNFFLSGLSSGANLELVLPEGYESLTFDQPNYQNFTQRLTCQRIVHVKYFPVPGARLTLQRVLEARVYRNYDYLWSLMTAEGQKLWRSKILVNAVMRQKDAILDKLEVFPGRYQIISEERLEAWSYPLTGKVYDGVSKFTVEFELTNGTKEVDSWYLIKEGDFWHYFPKESKELVDAFISNNWWVIHKKLKE